MLDPSPVFFPLPCFVGVVKRRRHHSGYDCTCNLRSLFFWCIRNVPPCVVNEVRSCFSRLQLYRLPWVTLPACPQPVLGIASTLNLLLFAVPCPASQLSVHFLCRVHLGNTWSHCLVFAYFSASKVVCMYPGSTAAYPAVVGSCVLVL